MVEMVDSSTAIFKFIDYGNKERKNIQVIFETNSQVSSKDSLYVRNPVHRESVTFMGHALAIVGAEQNR